jgi:hypothetical protein
MAKDGTGMDRVAPGTRRAVDFAQRQIFSPVTKVGPVPDGALRRSLQDMLCELQDSEINAGMETFPSPRAWPLAPDAHGDGPRAGPPAPCRRTRRS